MPTTSEEPLFIHWLTLLRSRSALVIALLMLVWAVGYLPGIVGTGARDLRLEEGRRATPAREMLQSGDFVVPTLYGERYLSKPPGFFWVVAAVGTLRGGVDELAVRIPSVMSVLLGAFLLLGLRGISREARLMAALLLISMPIILDKGTLGEIDALLSFVTFAAVVVWWNALDLEQRRVSWWGWITAGLILSASVLMKGPGGLAEFYAVIIGGLICTRRARALLAAGHVIMLLLTVIPVAIWIKMLLARTGMSFHDLTAIWAHQTGADVVAGRAGNLSKLLIDHYLMFPIKAISDMCPWIIFALAATFQRSSSSIQHSKPQRFFTCGWLLLIIAFWLWPKANPRYMMMGAYPIAIAAAIAISQWDLSRSQNFTNLLRSAGMIMAWTIGVVGGAAIMLSINLHSPALTTTCLAVAASFVVAVMSMWLTKRTPVENAALGFACNLALIIVLAWGMITSVAWPLKATTDPTRIVHQQINTIIPAGIPVYTTRIFSRNADCYNEQFYIWWDGGAKALYKFSDLPPGKSTVILLPTEWDQLLAVAPNAKELGRLDAKKKGGPTPMLVAEVDIK